MGFCVPSVVRAKKKPRWWPGLLSQIFTADPALFNMLFAVCLLFRFRGTITTLLVMVDLHFSWEPFALLSYSNPSADIAAQTRA